MKYANVIVADEFPQPENRPAIKTRLALEPQSNYVFRHKSTQRPVTARGAQIGHIFIAREMVHDIHGDALGAGSDQRVDHMHHSHGLPFCSTRFALVRS
jgi:hypothetical protein